MLNEDGDRGAQSVDHKKELYHAARLPGPMKGFLRDAEINAMWVALVNPMQ